MDTRKIQLLFCLLLLLLVHDTFQQSSSKKRSSKNNKKGKRGFQLDPQNQTYADIYQNLFIFFTSDSANSAAIELLKEQISNITQELNLLKEQQALHTGGLF